MTLGAAEKLTVNFTVHFLAASTLSYLVNTLGRFMSLCRTEMQQVPYLGNFVLESIFKT